MLDETKTHLTTHCLLCQSTNTEPHSCGMYKCRDCLYFFLGVDDRTAQQATFIPTKDGVVNEQKLALLKRKYPKEAHDKRELYKRYAKHFHDLFGNDLRALDVGASGGYFLNELEKLGAKPEHLHALEIEPDYKQLTKDYFGYDSDLDNIETYRPIDPTTGSIMTHHVIGLFDVLEHVNEFDQALARIADMLEPGGRVLFKLPARRWAYAKYRVMRALGRDDKIPVVLYIEPGGHLNYWDTDNIKRLEAVEPRLRLVETKYLKPTWTQFGARGWWRYILYAKNQIFPIRFFPEFVAEFERK